MVSDCRGCLGGNRGFLISGESIATRFGVVTEAGNSHPNQMAKMLYNKKKGKGKRDSDGAVPKQFYNLIMLTAAKPTELRA
jgi:hypothetical protein